ncbi:class I SAM-dependent methyltransferase [Calidifontibacter sp. DB0510]|uniref:Class I SAM-dependent methyltransferase n=1 Tax=Metallococcus carri TaxID=1656884 RepID=A0A967AY33_9MICO|nr:class I SAM-dependent methyltransferase [Metallococcus carri]NHN54549.1 class I SAM-dependent methyltransferase [Metallococcus carri]NOP36612.1 class I SAM-dependent methyltransferase [Calidifontibacter sp. DB2511S]
MAEPRSFLAQSVSRARIALRPRSRVRGLIPHGPRHTESAGWDSFPLDNSPLEPGEASALAEAHTGRLMHKWRHYPQIYDMEFGPYRAGFRTADGTARPLRFLEIGVAEGGSQVFWRSFFGPEATIFGVDIDPSCAGLVDPTVAQVRIGSQDDPAFLRSVVEEMGGVDVVLDDGSHISEHQQASFETLWPLLSDGGVYVIEDVHTAYWPGFHGGLRLPGTAVEQAKDLVDDLHRWYYRAEGAASRPARPDVWSVRFYDSVIALHKRSRSAPARFTRGAEQRADVV